MSACLVTAQIRALLPVDHPMRGNLANEVHARPPEPLETPLRASYVAVLVPAEEREAELDHVTSLCERFSARPPDPGTTHFAAQFGSVRFKWERHGEFSGYTLFTPGLSPDPFSEPVIAMLPDGWFARLPGATIVAAHAKLIGLQGDPPDPLELSGYFEGNVVVGAKIGDGAGVAYTDFRVHDDGFARFLVFNGSFTPRQAGRMLQRLFEIEAYRMMALLALPIARRLAPRTLEIERALAELTDQIAAGGVDDESLLHSLTRLAAEVESGLAASQFRFGACRAYHQLVEARISELREQRVHGIQTIGEFMNRRLSPAVATCATMSQRLHDLSERVAQASALLSTRVDITRERQNQMLLASMDRRAKLQLRLQQTVEGLSVAAIVYYVAGLVGYVAKGVKATGLPVDPEVVVGASVPFLVLAMMWFLRRVRNRLHRL